MWWEWEGRTRCWRGTDKLRKKGQATDLVVREEGAKGQGSQERKSGPWLGDLTQDPPACIWKWDLNFRASDQAESGYESHLTYATADCPSEYLLIQHQQLTPTCCMPITILNIHLFNSYKQLHDERTHLSILQIRKPNHWELVTWLLSPPLLSCLVFS